MYSHHPLTLLLKTPHMDSSGLQETLDPIPNQGFQRWYSNRSKRSFSGSTWGSSQPCKMRSGCPGCSPSAPCWLVGFPGLDEMIVPHNPPDRRKRSCWVGWGHHPRYRKHPVKAPQWDHRQIPPRGATHGSSVLDDCIQLHQVSL